MDHGPAARGPALAACAAGLALVVVGGASVQQSLTAQEAYTPRAPAAVADIGSPAEIPSLARPGDPAVVAAPVHPAVPARRATRSPRRIPPAPPVQLALPSLNLSARIAPVDVDAGGALDVPEDPDVLGWWRSGARPGDGRGSVVLDGHVDSAVQGLGTFARLRDLAVGDPVEVDSGSGERRRYRVTDRRQFPKASLPAAAVFSQDVQERLVLVTCGGRFDRETSRYDDNVVVFALPEAGRSGRQ